MQENCKSSERTKNKIKEICIALNYTIIEDFVNYSKKIKLLCNLHNHTWSVSPNNFLGRNSRCPVCSKKYLDNNIIDAKLKNREITRIGTFTHSSKKIKWQCNVDGYIWEATTSSILNCNNGCPKCSDNIRLTNEIIDEKIKNRQIVRVGNFEKNNKNKIEWKCKIDDHVWFASPNNILKGNGCPKCSGHTRITNEIIDEKIKNKDIIRLGSILNKTVDDKIKWKCIKCKNEWLAKTTSIISRGDGCPECKWMKTEKELYTLIKELNIKCVRQKRIDYENKRMFVDFAFGDYIFLEYNGQQHYKPVRFGGRSIKQSEKIFKKQIERDLLLKKYCYENNIKLIEIPYYEKKENWKSIILTAIGDIK